MTSGKSRELELEAQELWDTGLSAQIKQLGVVGDLAIARKFEESLFANALLDVKAISRVEAADEEAENPELFFLMGDDRRSTLSDALSMIRPDEERALEPELLHIFYLLQSQDPQALEMLPSLSLQELEMLNQSLERELAMTRLHLDVALGSDHFTGIGQILIAKYLEESLEKAIKTVSPRLRELLDENAGIPTDAIQTWVSLPEAKRSHSPHGRRTK